MEIYLQTILTILNTERNKRISIFTVTIKSRNLQELMDEINGKFAGRTKQPTYDVDGNINNYSRNNRSNCRWANWQI